MKLEKNEKLDQIVEAAARRFSHFGIGKTSLAEIAVDLAVTKQALSYYFPDKQSLVIAVIEKLAIDYKAQLTKEMEGSGSVEAALKKLTEVKGNFFEKYFMLATDSEHLDIQLHSNSSCRNLLMQKESALVSALFEKGVKTGELKPLDSNKTAELLIETLYAFSQCVKEKGFLPDPEAFRELFNKQQEVIKIFYQGLKADTYATAI